MYKFSKYLIHFCRGDEMLKYSQFIFYNLNKELKQIHMNFTLNNKNNYKLITEKLAITWAKLNFLHPFKERQ
ncbi:hypothetical protein TM01_04195 [Campylobacter jejuni subsp. jejuni]|uniref:hypothetical protein n=1 Tax=Campylobacter jejuni TaxID=197 RepID=UPI0005CEE87F|nr:hypothetical protein [Campylobacter jejuni]KJD25365.1 hypothetical protein TM01_04195 [Campylobacter jejuni subsp. jejuni]